MAFTLESAVAASAAFYMSARKEELPHGKEK